MNMKHDSLQLREITEAIFKNQQNDFSVAQQKHINLLTHLSDLALNLSKTTSLLRTQQIILDSCVKIFKGRNACIYSRQKTEGPFRQGITLEAGECKIPPDFLEQVLRVKASQIYFSHDHQQAIIGIPIQREQVVKDIICIITEEIQQITEQELDMADLLSAQLSGHIDKALLHEELRKNHERTDAIMGATRDGIILINNDSHIIHFNTTAEEILGLELSPFMESNFTVALYEYSHSINNDALAEFARLIRGNHSRILTHEFSISVNQKVNHIRMVISPVRNNESQVVGRLLSLRNISQEIMLENHRQDLQRMLLHDLRNPLSSVITGFILAQDIIQNPKETDNINDVINILQVGLENATNLMDMMENLITISRLKHAAFPLNISVSSLREQADKALQAYETTLRSVDIKYSLYVPDEVDQIEVDSEIIRRVLSNLIHNATRYTPTHGQIWIDAEVYHPDPQFVLVRVGDTGPGIPPDMHEMIFEEFTQIKDQKPLNGSKGSGLGLAFCKMAVEAHGGFIRVETIPDYKGAVIGFVLPRV